MQISLEFGKKEKRERNEQNYPREALTRSIGFNFRFTFRRITQEINAPSPPVHLREIEGVYVSSRYYTRGHHTRIGITPLYGFYCPALKPALSPVRQRTRESGFLPRALWTRRLRRVAPAVGPDPTHPLQSSYTRGKGWMRRRRGNRLSWIPQRIKPHKFHGALRGIIGMRPYVRLSAVFYERLDKRERFPRDFMLSIPILPLYLTPRVFSLSSSSYPLVGWSCDSYGHTFKVLFAWLRAGWIANRGRTRKYSLNAAKAFTTRSGTGKCNFLVAKTHLDLALLQRKIYQRSVTDWIMRAKLMIDWVFFVQQEKINGILCDLFNKIKWRKVKKKMYFLTEFYRKCCKCFTVFLN